MFGQAVQGHRQRLCLTQEELAGRSGVSVRTIRNIEAGQTVRARPGTVRLLADGFALHGAARDHFCELALADAAQPSASEQQTRPADVGWRAGRPIPAQLPADLAGFTGRVDHVRQLTTLLDNRDEPATVVISAIAGTAGVGKTTLAVHWCHQVRDLFPDGQLYVNLRGFDPTGLVMDPAEAVRGFLDAFAVPQQRIPAGLQAQAALYRSLLAGKRVLVILDNARDADQARPLLPGAPGCLAVVTSRNQLTSLVAAEGAHLLTLNLLSGSEAHHLLAGRLGAARLAAEPDAVNDIITGCAGLPLALAIVASRAATNSQSRLTALADQLHEARNSLDAFAGDDQLINVRAVFSWSYRTLSPAAARLFRLLGIHPGPDLATPAAASLTGLSPERVRPLLSELTVAHLVTEHTPGRYTFHDLLRVYAGELAHAVDTDTDRRAALGRVLDHYLHTSHAAARLINPNRELLSLPPLGAGVTPAGHADSAQAMAWLTAEHAVLLATIRHAADTGFDTQAWQLAWTIWTFLDRQGHWHDWAATQHLALAAAQRLADRHGQARTHRSLAFAYTKLARHDDARTHYQHALDVYSELGDPAGHGYTLINLGMSYELQGRYDDALSHAQHALNIFRAAEHVTGTAHALSAIGWLHTQRGDHEQGLTHCEQALILHQMAGEQRGEASTWDSLGHIHHHLGQHTQATTCYEQALNLYRETADRYGQAVVLTHLGDTHHSATDYRSARDAWQHALTILNQLDHPSADQLHAKLAALDASTMVN
jgi:tetratricopeptide (TPR) repeat protein